MVHQTMSLSIAIRHECATIAAGYCAAAAERLMIGKLGGSYILVAIATPLSAQLTLKLLVHEKLCELELSPALAKEI